VREVHNSAARRHRHAELSGTVGEPNCGRDGHVFVRRCLAQHAQVRGSSLALHDQLQSVVGDARARESPLRNILRFHIGGGPDGPHRPLHALAQSGTLEVDLVDLLSKKEHAGGALSLESRPKCPLLLSDL